MKRLLLIVLSLVLIASTLFSLPITSGAAALKEAEDNDTPDNANLITLGSSMTGKMSASWDFDYYKFISNEDGKINITFQNTSPNENYQCFWTIFLLGPNRETIGMKTIDLRDGNSYALPFIGAKAGNYYYLLVYPGPRYTDSHTYLIKTSFTKGDFYEKEVNNTEEAASELILANNYTGTIGGDYLDGDGNPCFDRDFYHIQAPAKGKMTIWFKHKKKVGTYDYSAWYLDFYKHQNGGNQSLNNGYIKYNSDDKQKIYSATIKKNAEFWFNVKSIQDESGMRTPSDVVGEPYVIISTFVLSAKPTLTAKATVNSITLTSKSISDITGYEVQMKSGDSFKKLSTVKKKALKITKKGLKKNKKYTFRVRAFLKKNGTTYYGNWVKISAKTKKK